MLKAARIIALAMLMPAVWNSLPAGAKETVTLETVTVTAQKRVEDVQDIPASITTLTATQIEDAAITDTSDLIPVLPNVHMQHNYSENVIVIRGLSSFNTSIYSPAGVYVDDVAYPLHYMHNPEFFDIERIEVLRGPQGTLYGRNSESGVLNIVTREPGDQFGGDVSGEYASYNTYRLGAKVNGPLVDDVLSFGLAAQQKSSDGYIENLHNGDDKAADLDHKNARFNLRWTPSGRLTLRLIADVMETDDHVAGYRYIDGPYKTDAWAVQHDADQTSEQDANSQALRVQYEADAFTVLSVTSRIDYEHDYVNEADLWNDPENRTESIFSYEDRQWSQELRFSSADDKRALKWLLGFYGFREETDIDYNYYVANMPSWFMANQSYMNPITEVTTKGMAGFGQGTYTLLDRLHLTAGMRFDHQRLDGRVTGTYLDMTNFGYANYDLDEKLEHDEWLPKASMVYDFSDTVMAYLSTAKGYTTGGFNYCQSPSDQTLTYGPEYTWNYEIGLKSQWLDRRIEANLALFYIDITDKQISEVDADTATVAIKNAAEAHSQGMELSLTARPVGPLEIRAGLGYTEAEFDDFTALEWNSTNTALVRNDYTHNDLPYAPKFTYSLTAQYRFPLGVFMRAELYGSDRFYGDYGNTAKQDAYEIVNLRLGYETEHYDVVLWGENVFDEEYLTYVTPYGSYNIGVDGAPCVVGVTLRYRF